MAQGAGALVRAARAADVIYASGFYSRSALAGAATGTPLVVKLTNDPAFERARSRGWFSGTLEEFQHESRDPRAGALKLLRTQSLRRASSVVVPSRFLAGIVQGWARDIAEPVVIPNPRPDLPARQARAVLRQQRSLHEFTAVFAGRFVADKQLHIALEAVARVPACHLVLVGDGPERGAVEAAVHRLRLNDRVRIEGPARREEVLDWLQAGDVAVLSSGWENYPHAAVEALSVGTPVVATAVGGVPEIVSDGENGMLVARGDVEGLAGALKRCVHDTEWVQRLRSGATAIRPGVDRDTAYAELERLLLSAASRRVTRSPGDEPG
jgi:glycosyltransferase involved in cell wall biosynthesis